MRTTLIFLACLFGVVGCNTTKVDDTVRKSLPALCKNASDAHQTFVAIAAIRKISQSTVDKEAAAYEAIQPLCRFPGEQTAITVLIQATQLYTVLTVTLKEAKKVE